MGKTYTDEFLILELQRFVRENSRAPKKYEMGPKNDYPAIGAYVGHFKTWCNALETAGFKLNQYQNHRQDGTETCAYCNKRADEINNFGAWYYIDGKRYCMKHGQRNNPDYVKGQLDINSAKGLGRAGEILVVKTLGIGKEHDCNRISCGFKFDMYHEEFGKIDVKTALLSYNDNNWGFGFPDKLEIKTFICLGMSSDRSTVEHVWIVPNEGDKRSFSASDTYRSLSNRKHWEVNSETYDNMWQTMKLDNCKIMVDKSKEETEEEKQKFEKFKKEYLEKLRIER